MKQSLVILASVIVLAEAARAQSLARVPENRVPPSVLAELRHLEARFDLALAQDCATGRCFPKGCTYVEHVVADRPPVASLPGLGQDKGPGSETPQEYLTLARCAFTHEKAVPARDVQALVKRLESKLSKGWLVVQVEHDALPPISPSLRESADEAAAEVAPPPEPPPAQETHPSEPQPWSWAAAARELWLSLLPHFAWMIALLLVTLAALVIIWALRRLGRESAAEQALLARLAAGDAPSAGAVREVGPGEVLLAPSPDPAGNGHGEYVQEQKRLWATRLGDGQPTYMDQGLRDLLRQWLKAGEMGLLAKAVLLFPDRLPLAFPSDGELAEAKLALADYLRNVAIEQLPSDDEFFRKLNQHALSSSLASQADAEIVRSLREEFGAAGLVQLMERLPPRHAALLFALAPLDDQHEVARLLSAKMTMALVDQLLISNRMDRDELTYLFDALKAARAGAPMPAAPAQTEAVDRGRVFDAASAISMLLPYVGAAERSVLFRRALERFNGVFPAWYDGILFADMLLRLPEELRADVLLDVDVNALDAWLALQSRDTQELFRGALPVAIRNALRAGGPPGTRAEQLARAHRGRAQLAAALHRQVARGRVAFEDMVV